MLKHCLATITVTVEMEAYVTIDDNNNITEVQDYEEVTEIKQDTAKLIDIIEDNTTY